MYGQCREATATRCISNDNKQKKRKKNADDNDDETGFYTHGFETTRLGTFVLDKLMLSIITDANNSNQLRFKRKKSTD